MADMIKLPNGEIEFVRDEFDFRYLLREKLGDDAENFFDKLLLKNSRLEEYEELAENYEDLSNEYEILEMENDSLMDTCDLHRNKIDNIVVEMNKLKDLSLFSDVMKVQAILKSIAKELEMI